VSSGRSSYVSRLSIGLVDGLIVVAAQSVDRYSKDLSSRKFPFVLLDHAGSKLANSVVATDAQGTLDAVGHLAGRGHRRIAYLAGNPAATRIGNDRLDGFRQAIGTFAIDDDQALIRAGDGSPRWGREAVIELLDLPRPPTAIVAGSDHLALATLAELAERGIDVPGRLSVVGFDDLPEATLVTPQLTTVRQPRDEMGRRAVALLLDQIDQVERPVAHLEVPTELVVRQSTGPVPG